MDLATEISPSLDELAVANGLVELVFGETKTLKFTESTLRWVEK